MSGHHRRVTRIMPSIRPPNRQAQACLRPNTTNSISPSATGPRGIRASTPCAARSIAAYLLVDRLDMPALAPASTASYARDRRLPDEWSTLFHLGLDPVALT